MAAPARPLAGAASEPPPIRALDPEDIPRLRLGWQHRHDAADLRRLLAVFPDRSVWAPETGEFALAGPWRHRAEIAAVVELAAVRQAEALLAALVERCQSHGARLVLMAELDERRRPSFYERAGFALVEEVVTYELERPSPDRAGAAPLTFLPVGPGDEPALGALLAIDHAAFPWLWWNSRLEFETYLTTPGVSVYLGLAGDRPVSYAGITTYAGWGHLDRIAVQPAAQGAGFGLASLAFATATLARRGARRIGLSTQRDNRRSQRLYEGFGFRRARVNDYRLYGAGLAGLDPQTGRISG